MAFDREGQARSRTRYFLPWFPDRVSGTDPASGIGDRLPDPSAVRDMDSDPVPPGCGDRGHCDY